MKLHDFYRRFADLPEEKKNTLLTSIRFNPLTPFFIYKQLETIRGMARYCKDKEEELLRIAEETFNQVE